MKGTDMGYWSQHADGTSFAVDSDMVWGDQPSDILDDAIDKAVEVFTRDVGRAPTKEEMLAGFKFCLGGKPLQ